MNFRRAFELFGMESQSKLARKADINEAVVRKMYHGGTSFNFVSLQKVAKALDVSVWVLVRAAETNGEKA